MVWWFVPCLLLLLTACSSVDGMYRYEGRTNHWKIAMEIVPNKESGAAFIGKMTNLSQNSAKKIHFVADTTNTSQQEGNIERINTGENVVLFQDVPNTESSQYEFKQGIFPDKVKQYFSTNPRVTITWSDEQDSEASESIELIFVE